jgi:hypothetical protein
VSRQHRNILQNTRDLIQAQKNIVQGAGVRIMSFAPLNPADLTYVSTANIQDAQKRLSPSTVTQISNPTCLRTLIRA